MPATAVNVLFVFPPPCAPTDAAAAAVSARAPNAARAPIGLSLFVQKRREVGLEQLPLILGHGVRVLRFGKAAGADIRDIRFERLQGVAPDVGVLLDELRNVTRRETQDVVPDEHLAVALGTGADADRRN